MLVQIYEIQEPRQAEQLLALGVDHLGSVIMDRENWRDPAIREVIRLTAGTPSCSSLIPLFSDEEAVLRVLDYYRPDIIHFCENLPLWSEDAGRHQGIAEKLVCLQAVVKEGFPSVKIMRSLPVPAAVAGKMNGRKKSLSVAAGADRESPDETRPAMRDDDNPPRHHVPEENIRCSSQGEATAAIKAGLIGLLDIFAPVSDFFMTDTLLAGPSGVGGDAAQPVAGFVGITGATCDWELAAWLVRTSPRPVILAGGLGPENVAAAIGRVHPAGVDSCTRTNAVDIQGRPIRFRKDYDKVRRFIAAARRAAAS